MSWLKVMRDSVTSVGGQMRELLLAEEDAVRQTKQRPTAYLILSVTLTIFDIQVNVNLTS